MNTYHITLLRGDGIGPEIVREAVKVLDAAAARYGFAPVSYTHLDVYKRQEESGGETE